MLSIIVAFGNCYEIGQDGVMPWHLPEDLKHFKEVTSGATILMGRRTFQSLPGVLPKRQHIIITADPSFVKEHKRVRISHDLEAELRAAQESDDEIFVIGGGQIYRQALPFADKLYLTFVHKTYPEADTFFPKIDWSQWEEVYRGKLMIEEETQTPFEFADFRRIR
ncbi:MAG: dihydrofolate reductase [Firmicutes bacterium]|nr:dihydrofolate reductase [Bacillota bacterium]